MILSGILTLLAFALVVTLMVALVNKYEHKLPLEHRIAFYQEKMLRAQIRKEAIEKQIERYNRKTKWHMAQLDEQEAVILYCLSQIDALTKQLEAQQ